MSTENPKIIPKRGRGRPRSGVPTVVLPLRVPDTLVVEVERFARLHGLTRNQAGLRLLRTALEPRDTSGYDPQTGGYHA